MDEDHFGDAVTSLRLAAGGDGEPDAAHLLAQAQVSALLAIASSLNDVAGELTRLRHAQGDWSE